MALVMNGLEKKHPPDVNPGGRSFGKGGRPFDGYPKTFR